MKLRISCVVAGFLLFVLSAAAQTASSGSASSQVPPLIQFSSVAADEGGNSLSGVVNFTFSLYASQQGGDPLWTETQNNVPLDATGHYSVQLGITKPNGVPTTLFTSGEARWLGVRIAEQVEQPRVLLLSVPYALKAGDAATIGGLPPSAFVLAASGTGSASTTFVASAASSSDTQAGIPAATDVTGLGTVNFIPLWTTTSNIGNSVLFQSAASPFKIGINTTTPATTLDVKGTGTIRGTLSLPATGTATATKGANSQPLNLVASAFNSTSSTAVNQTFEWQSEPAGNDTTTPSGTLNLLFGTGATKPAETGLHIANNGQITFATGQTFPGTGDGTITGVTTASSSGLTGGGSSGTLNLALTSACAKNQVLQWSGTAWACAAVGTGTVTSVGSGAGLTGGPITGSGTLSIPAGGVTNSMLATSYAQLNAGNTFAGNQTVNGTLTATSSGNSIVGNTSNATDAAVIGNGVGLGTYGSASSTSGYGVEGYASAATGATVGVFGQTASTSGYGVQGAANATTGTTYGVFGESQSPAGYGIYGQQLAATGATAGVYGATNSTSGYGVEGTGPVVGVYGTGLIGAEGVTSSPAGWGMIGYDSSATGTTVGVLGQTVSPAGYGVEGSSSGNIGVYGTGEYGVEGSGVVGVYGVATETTGNGIGVYGSTPSPSGTGVWGIASAAAGVTVGVVGAVNSPSGYGVVGQSPLTGVYGQSGSPTGLGAELYIAAGTWGDGGTGGYAGIAGTADDSPAGIFFNNAPPSLFSSTLYAENETTVAGGQAFQAQVVGLTNSTAIIGDPECGADFMALQLGQSYTGNGMSGCNNYTLMGDTSGDTYLNAASGGTIHLRVSNSSQLNVTAGNVDVLSTLTKPAGSFKIDHPLDPANKYLYHSFVESPDMMNIYNGNVTTDASGDAAVDLPEWFETLNRDFRYQLTVMGQFAQAIVAGKVANHQFRIKTDKPNVEVSWQVTGIRQDAFANAHRIQVEVEKAPADRGHYLYPELVGAPETERIGYMAVPPGSDEVVHQRPAFPRRRNASPAQQQTPLSNAVPQMPVLPSVAAPSVPKMPTPAKPPVRAVVQPVAVQNK